MGKVDFLGDFQAVAAADAGVPLRAALIAFLHAIAANLTSAGVRLIPLGQVAGQRIIEDLRGPVSAAAASADPPPMPDATGRRLSSRMSAPASVPAESASRRAALRTRLSVCVPFRSSPKGPSMVRFSPSAGATKTRSWIPAKAIRLSSK